MRLTRRVLRFLTNLFGRAALEREMTEEMRHHLELEIEERIRGGASPAEARRTALRDFGGVERWKEEARSSRGLGGWDALRQDLRFALRTLRGSPAFTVVAVTTLTVAIGATTSVFGVVEALLLEPLDYREPDRVVRLLEYRQGADRRYGTTSGPNFQDWIARAETLGEGALYDEYAPTLRVGDRSMKVQGASVEASYFEVLGVEPALGRFFLPEEDEPGSSRVVLSWGLWREAFGGDPGMVGRGIELSGFPYTVVGVARPFEDPGLSGSGFGAPRLWRSPSFYMSRPQAPLWKQDEPWVVVRAGVDPVSLGASIRAAIAAIDPAIPVYDMAPMDEIRRATLARPRFRTVLLLAFAAVAFLLAAIGVYGMVAYTVARRRPELGVRMALGADAARIRRLVVREGLGPVAAGALGGIAAGLLATRVLASLLYGVSATDPVTFVAAPLLLAGVAVLAAWLPARRAARAAPHEVLRLE